MKTNVPSTGSIGYIHRFRDQRAWRRGRHAGDAAAPPRGACGSHRQRGEFRGSLTQGSDPNWEHRHVFGLAYSPSKAALHAVTLAFANELEKTNIKVNVACPGYTATDLNDHRGTRTVEQGAREAVRLELLGPDGPTGTLSDEDGRVPW